MPTLSNEIVSFRNYYRRFRKQFTKDLLRLGSEQVIGVLLAIAILALQLYFRLIPASQTRQTWVSILLPYFVLVVVLCLLSLLRAPVAVDRERYSEVKGQAEQIEKLKREKLEFEELLHPKVPREEKERRQQVGEILKACNFSRETKAALRKALDFEGEVRLLAPPNQRTTVEILNKAVDSGLIIRDQSHGLRIRPIFQAALRFLLDNEET
jgi:hypothetical protein